jgi:hypothetical protein
MTTLIQRLREDLPKVSDGIEGTHSFVTLLASDISEAADEIERLTAERDAALADAVDAERYRWWRDHGYTTDSEKLGIENEMLPAGEVFATLDAAIDAAREEKT